MGEFSRLRTHPKVVRDAAARRLDKAANRDLPLRFGRECLDRPRSQGRRGCGHDGRWIPVAGTIVERCRFKAGDRVLDTGCAKGLPLKDLADACSGLETRGLEISACAVTHRQRDVAGRIDLGAAARPPYADNSSGAVICVNVAPSLEREARLQAVREMQRVSGGWAFIQVDAYRTEAERALVMDWVLTAKTFWTQKCWRNIRADVWCAGDYYWTILESNSDWALTGHMRDAA